MISHGIVSRNFCDLVKMSSSGPQRVPVPQAYIKPMAPQQQRIPDQPNGPQRIPRPISHQKPVTHAPRVKPACPNDQNVNPAHTTAQPPPQPKTKSHQGPVTTDTARPVDRPKMEKSSRKNLVYNSLCLCRYTIERLKILLLFLSGKCIKAEVKNAIITF